MLESSKALCKSWHAVRQACLSVLVATVMLAPVRASAADFEAVWEALRSDAYTTLPHYRVERQAFGSAGAGPDNRLRAAARRTLDSRVDLFAQPAAPKLFQPNGICFSGWWEIDGDSTLTGVFRPATRLRAIARLSVMLDKVHAGSRRALGAAIKLFPSIEAGTGPTVNILLMDTFAGSRRAHVLDAGLDNHPELGGLPDWRMIPLLLRIRADLRAAREDYRYIPLRGAASVGVAKSETIRAPYWLRMVAAPGQPRVKAADFRDELRLAAYPGAELVYTLLAAARHDDGKAHAEWQQLGRLRLTEDLLSKSCDQRLHFSHRP